MQIDIAVFLKENISFSLIPFKDNAQVMNHLLLKINLENKNWLMSCLYYPHLQIIDNISLVQGKGLILDFILDEELMKNYQIYF